MKLRGAVFVLLMSLLLVASAGLAAAADFEWTKKLDIRAEVDPSGFRASLSTRFKIGDAQINLVLGHVDKPADAYMIFRLGEMSSRSTEYVLQRYQADKGKGWGVLAKSLGIKPGSQEFHALKKGDDLGSVETGSKGNKKSKDKGKGKK